MEERGREMEREKERMGGKRAIIKIRGEREKRENKKNV
jgi:hypothetical protein